MPHSVVRCYGILSSMAAAPCRFGGRWFYRAGKRWTPILNYFDECGVDVCYEIHPGEDLFDGVTYEMFLEKVNNHKRACLLYDPSHFVLQQLDYLQCISIFIMNALKHFMLRMPSLIKQESREHLVVIKAGWTGPGVTAARWWSIDFKTIFSKLTQYGYDGWAVMEWECCIKHPEDGAKEGCEFIKNHIIRVTEKAFDDFAGTEPMRVSIKRY